jgi:hypothetical protein
VTVRAMTYWLEIYNPVITKPAATSFEALLFISG